MNKAPSASDEVVDEFRLCLNAAIATDELAPTDVKYIVGLLESCFRQIADDAIQAARTAPSQDRLDEEWDKGFNTAEEQYKKQLTALSPVGNFKSPEQWDKEGVCYASVAKRIQDDVLAALSAAAPSEDTKRLREAYENLRQIALARYCGHCDLGHTEDECTCGSYSLDAAMNAAKTK